MRADQLKSTVASWWRWVLVGSIAVLATLGALAAIQYRQLNAAYVDVEHADQVARAVDELLSVLVNAETGYRGYLLTANPVFLEPYHGVDQAARSAVVTLTALLAADVSRREDLSRLSGLVDQRLLEMSANLKLAEDGNREAAIANVRTAGGKAVMDQIRALASRLKAEQRAMAATRSQQAAEAARAARRFGIAAVTVALLLSFLVWALTRTMEQRRRELAAETIGRLEAERDAAAHALELQQSEAFNRGILDNSADAIAVLAPDGDITFMNRVGQQTFHVSSDAAWRETPFVELWPDDRAAAHEALRTAATGGDGRFVASRRTGATVQWWDVIVKAVHDGRGDVDRIVATARDVTEQKKADEERTQLLASEQAARSAAERAARLKDDFVSTLSHELRTPLNAILGWVGVLKQDHSPDTLAKAVDVIDRNSRRQSQMIDDLLDMGRILSGKLRLDVQRVELASVIEEAVLSALPSADAKGVRLLTTLGSAAIVRGDPGRLQQVVWNLLSNAIKFTPRGGQVQVTLHKVNSHVHMQVSDTGSGIAPELLPQVFDRFRQADSSATRRHGGLGLGLSIVKNLVELHGGTVDVASDGENAGATFTVRLPLALSSSRPEIDVDSRAIAPLPASLRDLQVLVLDDEEDARDVVKRLLEDAGATVTAASSVAEALSLLMGGYAPDVIVSDIGLPERDGYDFIQSVRRMTPPASRVPAAALTALARLDDRKRAMLSGFQTHLAKPVDPAELIATVASLAGRTGA
jgi:PAS domain S-box-containing protein